MLHTATFWLAVSMAIFLAVAGKPVARGFKATLDKRRDTIRLELEEAERLRAEAQELLLDSQRRHRDAVSEAEEIVTTAKADADRIRAEAADKLKQTLALREKQAMDKIAEAEATALAEARAMATELALAASREVLRQRLTGASADALIDKAINELPQKLAS